MARTKHQSVYGFPGDLPTGGIICLPALDERLTPLAHTQMVNTVIADLDHVGSVVKGFNTERRGLEYYPNHTLNQHKQCSFTNAVVFALESFNEQPYPSTELDRLTLSTLWSKLGSLIFFRSQSYQDLLVEIKTTGKTFIDLVQGSIDAQTLFRQVISGTISDIGVGGDQKFIHTMVMQCWEKYQNAKSWIDVTIHPTLVYGNMEAIIKMTNNGGEPEMINFLTKVLDHLLDQNIDSDVGSIRTNPKGLGLILASVYMAALLKIDIQVLVMEAHFGQNNLVPQYGFASLLEINPPITTPAGILIYDGYKVAGKKIVMVYNSIDDSYGLIVPTMSVSSVFSGGWKTVRTIKHEIHNTVAIRDASIKKVDPVMRLVWWPTSDLYSCCSLDWLKMLLVESNLKDVAINDTSGIKVNPPKSAIDAVCKILVKTPALHPLVINPNLMTELCFYLIVGKLYTTVGCFQLVSVLDISDRVPTNRTTYVYEMSIQRLDSLLGVSVPHLTQNELVQATGHIGAQLISHSVLVKSGGSNDGYQSCYTKVLYIKYGTGTSQPHAIQFSGALEEMHFPMKKILVSPSAITINVPVSLMLVFYMRDPQSFQVDWTESQLISMLPSFI